MTEYVFKQADQPYQALDEAQLLARFDRLVTRMAEQNAAIDDDEVASDVAAARDERTARN